MAFTFQVNTDIKFIHDEKFLAKAESYKTKIYAEVLRPSGFVELVHDASKLNGAGVKAMDCELTELALKRDDKIIIDFGRHIVGKFSITINKTGSPQDAPLYMRIKFAEMPAELQAESSDYEGWLSRIWIQEEFIHVDELSQKLQLPLR